MPVLWAMECSTSVTFQQQNQLMCAVVVRACHCDFVNNFIGNTLLLIKFEMSSKNLMTWPLIGIWFFCLQLLIN